MEILQFAAIFVLSVCCSLVSTVLCAAYWGTGGLKIVSARVTALEDDQTNLKGRFEREQKRRASEISAETRSATAAAERTLAARPAAPATAEPPVIAGRW